jgi:energy-coupling factor transporter ATP-binding protein EcfA2
MCGLFSCGSEDPATTRDKRIKAELDKQKKKAKKETKLLLLGTGESGKSTILKQMKILHMKGFSKEDKQKYKQIIHRNILDSIYSLVKAMNNLGVYYGSQDNISRANRITKHCTSYAETDDGYPDPTSLIHTLLIDIKALWSDNGIQSVYIRRSEFHLNDSAK